MWLYPKTCSPALLYRAALGVRDGYFHALVAPDPASVHN